MSSLTIEQVKNGSTLQLKLGGQIDEEADYASVPTKGVGNMVFDFEKIKLINSTGLQRWIKFLSSIDKGTQITFTRCSIRVITQINMFPGFVAGRNIKIESFFAPYFCEKCDSSRDILLDASKHNAELMQFKAPKMACPSCGGAAEFDGIEKKYFLFMKAG